MPIILTLSLMEIKKRKGPSTCFWVTPALMPPVPESSPLWQRFDISKIVFNPLKYFSSDPIFFIKWYDIYVLSNASDTQDVLYHNTRIIGSVSRFIVGSKGM